MLVKFEKKIIWSKLHEILSFLTKNQTKQDKKQKQTNKQTKTFF